MKKSKLRLVKSRVPDVISLSIISEFLAAMSADGRLNAVNDKVAHHREAGRLFREQVKTWEKKGKRSRANFFREQANWHDREAARLEDNEEILTELTDVFLLLAREIFTKTGMVAYKRIPNTFLGLVGIKHPFLQITLTQEIPLNDIPGWIPEANEEDWAIADKETQRRMIDRYLRPIEEARSVNSE